MLSNLLLRKTEEDKIRESEAPEIKLMWEDSLKKETNTEMPEHEGFTTLNLTSE